MAKKQVLREKRIDKLAEAVKDQPTPQQSSGSIFKGKGPTHEIDNLPKRKEPQSFKEITATSVIELPKNQVKPVNQRIFCFEQDPGEMKTQGGIIVPSSHNLPDAKGGKARYRKRYFVIDVADDCTVMVPVDPNNGNNPENKRKLARGDEVYPFIPQEAEEWSFPTVFDFYVNAAYLVFHETELAGVGMSSLLKKEKK